MSKKIGCKPGSRVHVVTSMWSGVIDDVSVFCTQKDANAFYRKSAIDEFGSVRKMHTEMEHGEPKMEIFKHTTKLE